MATSTGHRYSQGKKDIGAAKAFPWEHPVPDDAFWRPLDYAVARNFLQCFSADELARMSLDGTAALAERGKLELLLGLLRQKLAAEDAAAAAAGQTFYDVDFARWDRVLLGMYTVQARLGHGDAEGTIRELVARNKDGANLSHKHTLAGLLEKQGKFKEAEETEIPVRVWLDERLGEDSPQALGARRIIATAVWKQGEPRRSEAKELFAEVLRLIGESEAKGGQFAVYQEEERKITKDLIAELESGFE